MMSKTYYFCVMIVFSEAVCARKILLSFVDNLITDTDYNILSCSPICMTNVKAQPVDTVMTMNN